MTPTQLNISRDRCALVKDALACAPFIGFFIFAFHLNNHDKTLKSLIKSVKIISDNLAQKNTDFINITHIKEEDFNGALNRSHQLVTWIENSNTHHQDKKKQVSDDAKAQIFVDTPSSQIENEVKEINQIGRDSKKLLKDQRDDLENFSDDFSINKANLDELRKKIRKNETIFIRNVKLLIVSQVIVLAGIISCIAFGIFSLSIGLKYGFVFSFSFAYSIDKLETSSDFIKKHLSSYV